jgi:nucleotide-binding universal stress UspA family protein
VSRRALDHAVAIARWYASRVTVLHVVAVGPLPPIAPYPGSMIPEPVGLSPEQRERLAADLDRFARSEQAVRVPVDVVVGEGQVATAILEQSDALGADLLVMGTHGRSGFERWLLGSVTEKVLRKAKCPVLSVPPAAPDAVPSDPVLFKRLLCPVDFSPSSANALKYALSLVREAEAGLTVVHVLELPPDIHGEGPLDLGEYRRAYEEEARRRLAKVLPEAADTAGRVQTVIATGKSYREILRLAADQRADLIVMGVQGRGAVDRWFFGSTTEHVVRQATCPVLTLRQD